MKTVQINTTDLSNLILSNVDKAGSSDWFIDYSEGQLDLCHNTHTRGDFAVYEFYNGFDEEWLDLENDEVGNEERIEWIKDALGDFESEMWDEESQELTVVNVEFI